MTPKHHPPSTHYPAHLLFFSSFFPSFPSSPRSLRQTNTTDDPSQSSITVNLSILKAKAKSQVKFPIKNLHHALLTRPHRCRRSRHQRRRSGCRRHCRQDPLVRADLHLHCLRCQQLPDHRLQVPVWQDVRHPGLRHSLCHQEVQA